MDDGLEAQIAAAEAYEDLHVPAIFGQWAPLVLEAADLAAGDRVLDVACGTGVLAREAARRVGARGTVTGLDPAGGMLAVAKRLQPAVEWHEGVAATLPFADGSFDVVASQFGLMFFPDREAALREMLRVLVSAGRLSVAVWGALDRSPAYSAAVELLERRAGKAAADALRAPFVLGDPAELDGLLAAAGAAAVTVVEERGLARFPSVRSMIEAELRGWLPIMGVHLEEALIETILAEAEEVLELYVAADGRVVFEVSALIATGRKP